MTQRSKAGDFTQADVEQMREDSTFIRKFVGVDADGEYAPCARCGLSRRAHGPKANLSEYAIDHDFVEKVAPAPERWVCAVCEGGERCFSVCQRCWDSRRAPEEAEVCVETVAATRSASELGRHKPLLAKLTRIAARLTAGTGEER